MMDLYVIRLHIDAKMELWNVIETEIKGPILKIFYQLHYLIK